MDFEYTKKQKSLDVSKDPKFLAEQKKQAEEERKLQFEEEKKLKLQSEKAAREAEEHLAQQ